MSRRFHDLTFTAAVRALQELDGSRASYERAAEGPVQDAVLTAREADFLAERDSFFIASSSASGWPYIQHRGGPPGFVQAIGPDAIAFPDFAGNRQFITAGNAAADDRVALIVVDYAHRRRLKLLGHLTLHALEPGSERDEDMVLPAYPARIERLALVRIVGFDWNCPQHILPRFTEREIEARVAPLRAQIVQLERELADARRA